MTKYTERIRGWLYNNRKEYKDCIIASANEIAGNIPAEISSKLADPDTIVTI